MRIFREKMGKLSEGLSKPEGRFVDEMIYGLTASQSVMFSEISRSLNEIIPLIKKENRLCRNLGKRELCRPTDYETVLRFSDHLSQNIDFKRYFLR